MNPRHTGHIERRTLEWNPRTTPRPRELETLQTWFRLAQQTQLVRQVDVAKALGVNDKTVNRYFTSLRELGLLRVERTDAGLALSLTAAGRALVADEAPR